MSNHIPPDKVHWEQYSNNIACSPLSTPPPTPLRYACMTAADDIRMTLCISQDSIKETELAGDYKDFFFFGGGGPYEMWELNKLCKAISSVPGAGTWDQQSRQLEEKRSGTSGKLWGWIGVYDNGPELTLIFHCFQALSSDDESDLLDKLESLHQGDKCVPGPGAWEAKRESVRSGKNFTLRESAPLQPGEQAEGGYVGCNWALHLKNVTAASFPRPRSHDTHSNLELCGNGNSGKQF